MKLFLFLSIALLTSSAISPGPSAIRARCPERLGYYDGYLTPASILQGIARAESTERDGAIGDDGISRGRMQLNSHYDAPRARAWGKFDPFSPIDSVRIASCIFQDNLKQLGGDEDLAIAAYRQGVGGVLRDGPTGWYVARVRGALNG